MRTLRPVSSTTSRKTGDSGEECVALCAWESAAGHKKATKAARAAGRSRGGSVVFKNPPRFRREILRETKKPHETPGGFRPRPFSRRARASAPREGGLAYGCSSRLQWRDRGRFARPSPLPRLQIENLVYAAREGVSMQVLAARCI